KKEVTIDTEQASTKTDTVVEAEKGDTDTPRDSVAEMKAWEAYATPGEMHKMMADEVGTWDCVMTFWSPDGKKQKGYTTAEIKMILGGRYQESIYKGTMMGQPFEGKATLAYNKASKEFTTTFIDNMGTGMMTATGKYEDASKSVTYRGTTTDPMDGTKIQYREVYTIIDGNTRRMEMFDAKEGKEYKTMQIDMKRK
ncbi:MAG: DUF1579 domain-containing protein, partial [Flavobacterium sp.]